MVMQEVGMVRSQQKLQNELCIQQRSVVYPSAQSDQSPIWAKKALGPRLSIQNPAQTDLHRWAE